LFPFRFFVQTFGVITKKNAKKKFKNPKENFKKAKEKFEKAKKKNSDSEFQSRYFYVLCLLSINRRM
jgi:hypothetical protein